MKILWFIMLILGVSLRDSVLFKLLSPTSLFPVTRQQLKFAMKGSNISLMS